ncbi:rhodanese-like domain-containing protein [Niveibacterium sp. SC-1]|uniref:rhodanese-like domain-containing protein n=1 Tax=Niveibacterium sp. SC-1 TaxID=3135646 RepID=UPI00311DD9DA
MAHLEEFLRLADDARTRVPEIDAEEARRRVAEGAVLIDVRDADELSATPSIPGAINLSRGRIELKIADAVPDREAPLVLYCGGGNRSVLAADSLRALGYRQVFNLRGGLKAWQGAD